MILEPRVGRADDRVRRRRPARARAPRARAPARPRSTPTTADSRTPGSSSSTRSTSSGKTFSPSGVTIISFLRPLMNSRPCASRSPMSPVCSQPSASNGAARPWAVGAAGLARRLEVAARDVLAAHEDLAVVGDADLDAGDRRADRSLARLERVVQRDDRRGFGEAVALDDGEPHAPPELLEVGRQRRGADDERPELQAERRVHAAVAPPAAGNRDARRAAPRPPRETRARRARAARRGSSARRRAPTRAAS